jgi:formylglycine-generating enzyme required for sulfatase activity
VDTPHLTDVKTVPAQTFTMGSDRHYPEEAPAHRVGLVAFVIEAAPVTNAQFARFVRDCGYRTVAERPLDPAAFPGAPAENLVPGSLVFTSTPGPVDLRHLNQWWTWVPGAFWKRPEGPGSTLAGRMDHPVVHVAFEDAAAYADWAGRALPTEAQGEAAARGGLDQAEFTWGTNPEPADAALANYWHGDFPWRALPGYGRTSAVGAYPANGYGLHDMAGNVWEWTTDWYGEGHHGSASGCCAPQNPRGVAMADSFDVHQPQFAVPRRVIKGGSFLCADSYCRRYRPSARRPQMIDTGMSHIGFRCVTVTPVDPS